ncbi:MAG: ISAs1 family transposase [Burkholderia sp.]
MKPCRPNLQLRRRSGADYVLVVRNNQPTLADSHSEWFASVQAGGLRRPYWEHTTHDKGRGRIETRVCRVSEDVQWLLEMGQHWTGVQQIVMMARTRQIGDQTTTQQTGLISSRPMNDVGMSRLARVHWGIENQPHWVLDVSWGENAQQTRNKAAAKNLACVRKITLNLARM